jgi:hypothetical protein
VEGENTDNDALPAVGKVYDGPTRSLSSIFAASRRPAAAADPHQPRPNVEPIDTGEFASVMQKLRAALRPLGPGFDGLLVSGQIVSVAGGQAVIRYSHEHEASALMLDRNGKRETVQRALSEVLNEPIGLKIEVEPAPPTEPTSIAPAQQPSRGLRFDSAHHGQSRNAAPRQDDPPPPPPTPSITPEQKQQILATDPLVRAACDLFGGDIVKAE